MKFGQCQPAEFRCGDIGDGSPDDRPLGGSAPLGSGTQPEQADGTPLDPVLGVEFDGHGRTRDREVAVPRANACTAKPVRPDQTGNRTARSSSSAASEFSHRPVKNSDAAIRRSPRDDAASMVASRVSATAANSAGRVGVRDRAAEGALVADLEVPDVG